jgi:hypothetical protein
MVNTDYYIDNKKNNNVIQESRKSLARGITNAVAGLSLYTIWYEYIRNSIEVNKYIEIFFNTVIGLFLLISVIYIASIFFRWIRNILYDKEIKTSIENFTDMFLFAQLFMGTVQILALTGFRWSIIIILALFVISIVIIALFYLIIRDRAIYKTSHLAVIATLFLLFYEYTFCMLHMEFGFILYIFCIIFTILAMNKYFKEKENDTNKRTM